MVTASTVRGASAQLAGAKGLRDSSRWPSCAGTGAAAQPSGCSEGPQARVSATLGGFDRPGRRTRRPATRSRACRLAYFGRTRRSPPARSRAGFAMSVMWRSFGIGASPVAGHVEAPLRWRRCGPVPHDGCRGFGLMLARCAGWSDLGRFDEIRTGSARASGPLWLCCIRVSCVALACRSGVAGHTTTCDRRDPRWQTWCREPGASAAPGKSNWSLRAKVTTAQVLRGRPTNGTSERARHRRGEPMDAGELATSVRRWTSRGPPLRERRQRARTQGERCATGVSRFAVGAEPGWQTPGV